MSKKINHEKLLADLEKYIDETDIPIVSEFAYKNGLHREQMYQLGEEFSYTIKKLISKKEAQLERKGLNKEIDKTMAIFSLKQLGWRDVQEVEVNVNPVEVAAKFGEMVSLAGTGQATRGHK